MSNSNTNLQTQSSNALHNAIMEAGSKDRPPMLAPGNYVQWKSRIKRYIDTKPNSELIHLLSPKSTIPVISHSAEKTVPVAEGSSETTTKRYMENYKNVSQDIRDQLNIEAEAVQIILTGIDNDILLTFTTSTSNQKAKVYDTVKQVKTGMEEGRYDNQRAVNVAGARENVGNVRNPKTSKGCSYHTEKMLCVKQEKLGSVECRTTDRKDDIYDDESETTGDLEAHYIVSLFTWHRFKVYVQIQFRLLLDQSYMMTASQIISKNTEINFLESIQTRQLLINIEKVNIETNQLMFKDLKKFQAELDKYNDSEYAVHKDKPMAVPIHRTSKPKQNENQFCCNNSLKKTVAYRLHRQDILEIITRKVNMRQRTVKFGNDQIAPILGYRDLVQGTITIKRVYYVEGLNHNLFSVGQFCDADLKVAFQKSTCYIHDLKGTDLLTGSHGTDLYSISLQDSTTPNPICLIAKATSSQAWLWHHRLSHLNFDTINLLSKNNIVNGLPKLKFVKDHLCSSCELGKAKKEKSINGKKYVLVIVDDYSRYTWTHFLMSKDKTPGALIDFLTLLQRGLHAQAARTMLSAAKVPLFFWAEAIRTTCFTQNRSLVIPRHEKTPYHIINARKPSVKFFHIFGSLCYIVRDGENLDKMKEKDPVYDEAGPSYDLDILSEVHYHDQYQDVVCEHHEEYEMHGDVQPNSVVDSYADYTSDSNMILYDQYVKDNAVPVVQSNVSSVPNDAYMMIYNNMYEPYA
ncbi:retrovirus-related pol polyprotein from transposon TNT 1-94 [Tanacetum coccineum]